MKLVRVSHGKRNRAIKHRPGSKADRIERALLPLTRKFRGTPSTYAILLSQRLGCLVNRQEVFQALKSCNYTKTGGSFVPGFSVPRERRVYLQQLFWLWRFPDQVIFVDEKKFRNQDLLDRAVGVGYAPVGQRCTKQSAKASTLLRPILPTTMEVCGAIGYMPHLALPLRDGSVGDVGMITFTLARTKLTPRQILRWIKHDLLPVMTPFPGPRSIAVFDNMPTHRKHKTKIERWFRRRGAFVLWNPPQSPDLNPLEKFWDIVLAHAKRWMVGLAAGLHGASRKFAVGDLMMCLMKGRLSLRAFHDILNYY
jgi:hypothetical protein